MTAQFIHGTCVVHFGQAVLLVGASGSGKSDLALRLIDRGAKLVGDDYLEADVRADALWVRPAPRLAGLIEVRNVGICAVDHLDEARVDLLVRLDTPPERLPQEQAESIFGVSLPRLCLNAYEASAPIKVEFALNQKRMRA